MSESRSESGTYGGIALILLVAIAALAMFRFDLFGVQSWLQHGEKPVRPPVGTPGDPPSDPASRAQAAWDPTPPPDGGRAIAHTEPLKERIVVTRNAGALIVELPMRLVRQGWFPMGANDGVHANSPQRWVWMNDFYLAETECTNEQYYAFILGDGYESSRWWTPEGHNFIRAMGARGTDYLGWVPLDQGRRVWSLASPHVELTLEFLESGGLPVPEGRKVLIFPNDDEHAKWIQARDGKLWTKILGQLRETDGAQAAVDERIVQGRYLRTTNAQGRVPVVNPGKQFDYVVVAWLDGDYKPPVITYASRGSEHELRGPTFPVVGVSWFEADACARFFGGSLPTEAQWEKAARGEQGLTYPWGNEADWTDVVDGRSGSLTSTPHANIRRHRVTPVGSFASGRGPYGHHDLAGNVSEWCRDAYMEDPDLADTEPFVRGLPGYRRVERGTNTYDDDCLPSVRRRNTDPYSRGGQPRGFRIAMTVQQARQAAE
jgi:formylglycine-generating enzyme required for sulfatase activity